MAEFVEWRKERALPQYELLRSLNLCQEEEIEKLKKSRESFEYRIAQQSKTVKDYLEYIKYERGLVTLIRERNKLYKTDMDQSLIKLISVRMKQIYSEALTKFPHDIRFWDEYIKFMQQFKFLSDISPTFDRMLQFHGEKPMVWVRAALWEYNENYADNRVKGILLRAQHRHPDSLPIYTTFLQIELENKRNSSPDIALKLANAVYSAGKQHFNTVDYYIDMLYIANKFEYAKSFQQHIMDDLRRMFAREEISWHTLAQRELTGTSTENLDEFLEEMKKECLLDEADMDDSQKRLSEIFEQYAIGNKTSAAEASSPSRSPNAAISSATTPKGDNKKNITTGDDAKTKEQQELDHQKRIETCVRIYETAISVLNTTQMWDYYLTTMFDINVDLATLAPLKRNLLNRALHAANNSGNMSEEFYLKFVELLYAHGNGKQNNTITTVLERAIRIHSSSAKLWAMAMRFYVLVNEFRKVIETFDRAKILVGAEGVEVWKIFMIYLKTCPDSDTEVVYEKTLQDLATITYPSFYLFKARLLDMNMSTGNIRKSRLVYQSFIKHCPKAMEIHDKMLDLELKQMRPDLPQIRRILERMVHFFGESRTDVWLRYMNFEQKHGDSNLIPKLYTRAQKRLRPDLITIFNGCYDMIIR